jgi:hypothetical protein
LGKIFVETPCTQGLHTCQAQIFQQEEISILMFVDPCIKVNSHRNGQQDATVYQNLLFHVYMKLNMFRATHRPSAVKQIEIFIHTEIATKIQQFI